MKFSDFSSASSMRHIYLDLYKMSSAILDEKLHYFAQEQIFVDVYKLAAAYGINIYDIDMTTITFPGNDFLPEVFGYLNTYSGTAIYLNKITESPVRRYSIVYLLSYYLLNGAETRNYVHYLIPASFSADFREQICHLLASFLLMPIESVTKLMLLYREQAFSSQISFSSWLNYLESTMGIPAYYAAAAFEAVRTLHAFLNEKHTGF